MAYFAAVISLKHTIKRLLDSSHISILPSDREFIESTDKKIDSLHRVLSELDSRRNNIKSKRLESLREQIRDAAYRLEDALDSHVSDQFLSQSERLGDKDSNSLTLSLDVSNKVLKQEIKNFANMVEKVEDKCSKRNRYSKRNKYSLPEEEEEEKEEGDDEVDSSGIGSVGTEIMMVGLSKEFELAKRYLYPRFHSYIISGMAGIGKTTVAKNLYYDVEVCNRFSCRLWVTIGQKYQFKKVMLCLLAQLDYDIDNVQIDGDEKLGDYLYASLRSRTSLIVLDDVWDRGVCDDVSRYLPLDGKSCQLLVTTRRKDVALNSKVGELRFLNEEESWCLLREKVFDEKSCPYQLEKVGKKIAKNCDGLPLLIVTVADLLSKTEKTVEYWTKIAEGEDKSIFIEANDKISDILLRSYKYLTQDLKACFLYMAVFPLKCVIPASKLYNLWFAEDISTSRSNVKFHLFCLISDNLVLKRQDSTMGGIKTCTLHFSFWHACGKQSRKEKFLHAINNFADISREGVKSWRRLCIYNSVLFGIKEIFDSIGSISCARSLICSGPNHQYPVPICYRLRLLKVLDVLSIRFYKFPIEVLKLIHLRYLALTCNGKITPSICKLWNLEYLILGQLLSIKFLGDRSYLPLEIWNMQKLRHLQVMGDCLPYLCDTLLPKLLKLLGISVHSCTKEIFRQIPNLQKLGIQIELAPNSDSTEPLSCFDHLSHLEQLESLKCVIVNPNPARPQLVTPPVSDTTFPSRLKKLSLSGFGYPWNYMRAIGKLPNLEVLKLRSYAFRGPVFESHGDEFPKLYYLLLEDLDLVYMKFPAARDTGKVRKLVIKHCYKLESIPSQYFYIVELVDSPLIAKYIRKSRYMRNQDYKLDIHSSWEEGDARHKSYLSTWKIRS